ncbi:uncharacterized protein BYT42DRAFT_617945 [Radiomyces spectabilis]|uniref:uncharacterized protein n=1 Tax=Radiomyces spectabilis TaxID=64574 RepID=UPI00221E9950|nr:uncharacterized protein BYT42DRAFT_617945 [Radiomyces spectabilis]KAI8367521.1 hypothetical protein BYT42DRAFT_617945 [Radiomyces spectabilis]
MHIEIAQAVDFFGRLLNTKIDHDGLSRFKEELAIILKQRFADHWDPQQPFRGNGYRAINNFNGLLDPVLGKAAEQAKVSAASIHTNLPRDFVLWIDPFSVSYRVGDHGNIMTLFEDRSRGRITFKVDPSITNHGTPSATGNGSGNGANAKEAMTNGNSPLLSFIQPRTSTPIRISPPSSPEMMKLKTHLHQSSPLAKQVQTQQPVSEENDDDKQHKLVMAN